MTGAEAKNHGDMLCYMCYHKKTPMYANGDLYG
jgi:hypothetical protein